jgi:hypothetical protein
MLGAICAWTRSGPVTRVPVTTWNSQRIGWYCMDAKDLGKYKKFIEDACRKDKNCIDEVTKVTTELQGGK